MNKIDIKQDHQLVLSKKTINWLVENTDVAVFKAVDFSGYQRKIDIKHCEDIVKFLEGDFLLPTAIICACDEFNDDVRLRIVDGQHRIAAFRMLKEKDIHRYEEIKEIELPVIVLVGAPIEVEIETFIKINKTSKKVDTSLAFVLKNKLSHPDKDNLAMSKSEYIAVEIAKYINENENNKIWYNKILFEGVVRNSNSYISLNSFVKATRVLVNILDRNKILNLKWDTDEDVQNTKDKMIRLLNLIWTEVYNKWPSLQYASLEEKQIIQGSIGYTSIIRFIIMELKDKNIKNINELETYIKNLIHKINISESKWKKGGEFSKYSSEGGIKMVALELHKSMN